MNIKEVIIGVLIHLIIPLIGLFFYFKLIKQMELEEIEETPKKEFFVIFATYGGLLLVILTTFLWVWSGMATLGFVYLLIGAPIVLGIIASRLKSKIEISKYHNWAYKSSIWYFAIGPATLIVLLVVINYLESNSISLH